MNKQNPNINFSVEGERNAALPFIDLKIYVENRKFATSVYRNEIFCDAYRNFTSLLHLNTSLGFYTPFFIGVFAYFWVFQVSYGT